VTIKSKGLFLRGGGVETPCHFFNDNEEENK